MSRIWIFFTEHKALAYLLIVALFTFGVASLFSIQRESAPEVQIPVAVITSVLPGASPEDVENLIAIELERAVANIDGVKKLTSTSREGLASVVVEFEASADLKESIDKVKDAVDTVRGELPDDATDPLVTEVNFSDQPIVIASIVSDLPVTEFRDAADELTGRIESLPGVSRAEVSGVRAPEVTVVVRKEDLVAHGLSLGQVIAAIRTSNVAAPVGTIMSGDVEYAVEFKGTITDPELVAEVPITTPAGVVLRLSDIAFVGAGVEDYSTIARVSTEGALPEQAATLSVYKQRGADVTALSRNVGALIEEENKNGGDVSLAATYDAGDQIIKDLRNLSSTGLQTVLLVLLVLLVALGWRESLIASIAIPLSFLTALMVMQATGNTINFISLFSLILAVGILVDTAIVVVEAIHTNLKKGLDRHTAAVQALREYHFPLTTGTLTTVAVFFPLFTISGVTGEFIASIPFTVIAVLFASLVISLAFIPLFASSLLAVNAHGKMAERQEAYAERVREWYRRKLPYMLDSRRRKWWFTGGLLAGLIVLMALPFFGLIRVAFFPQGDVDYLYVNIEGPQGTPLQRTDLSARTIEEKLLNVPEIESFTTTVGAGSVFDQNPQSGPRFASITVNLRTERERSSTEILRDLEQEFAQYTQFDVRVLLPSEGPPSGAPVLVTFYGEDLQNLKRTASRAADILRDIPGTRAVTSSGEDDASEFALTIDRVKAAELGLSPADIASTLRAAVFGTEATTIKRSGDEIAVVVKLNLNAGWQDVHETNHVAPDALLELPVSTPKGTVLLGSVLTPSLEAASDVIRRENEERIATASSQVEEGFVAREVSSEFERRFRESGDMPEGVRMRLGGETEDVDQSFRDMFRALGMGLVLILVILIVQFNSYKQALIVLTTVPLSLIGVLLGLLLTREYLSFPSMLGFIALAGIVVNNAIILVDVYNRMREDEPERPLRDIVLDGSALRIRPIFLTTLTTVIGLVPLIFASSLWRPIAVAIIFGLTFAVFLILVLVPALYLKLCKKPVQHY